jgi:hypothetical protein
MRASFLAASPYSVLFSRHVIHAGVELPPNSAGTISGAVWVAENTATQHSPARHGEFERGADQGGHVVNTAAAAVELATHAACEFFPWTHTGAEIDADSWALILDCQNL